MKHNVKDLILGFILGLIVVSSISVFAVSEVLSKNIEYDNSNSGLNATNAQDAIDEIYNKYGMIGKSWLFEYKGYEETFTIPFSGKYKIEVWGASGGDAVPYDDFKSSYPTYLGGYGGYSSGYANFSEKDVLYINVGGAGQTERGNYNSCVSGGYNGGGSVCGFDGLGNVSESCGSGGGATHIATKSGLLSTLSDNTNKILIVAGGGGGATYYNNSNQTYESIGSGGSGGGYVGNNSYGMTRIESGKTVDVSGKYAVGGAQQLVSVTYSDSISGTFGQGGSYDKSNAGGGGGYYGGASGTFGAGGGSGYIGNSLLSDKTMYCYNCNTSSNESTFTVSNTCFSSEAKSNCSKQGNGYAKITLVSID